MKFDYLIDKEEKHHYCVLRKNILKNERKQDIKTKRNRLNSNQNIFLLNRKVAFTA